MAKAETSTQAVIKKKVTLTLSEEEAQVLMTLTGMCTGDFDESPRKHSDNVYDALQKAGISAAYLKYAQGSIRFLTKPKLPSPTPRYL